MLVSPPHVALAPFPEQTDTVYGGPMATCQRPAWACWQDHSLRWRHWAQADCSQGLVLTKDCHQKPTGRFRIRYEWGSVFLPIEEILLFLSFQEHMVASVRWKKEKQGLIPHTAGHNICPSACSFLLHQDKGGLARRQVVTRLRPVYAEAILTSAYTEAHPRGKQHSPLTWRHWDELVFPFHAATYDWGHKHHQDNCTPCTPCKDVDEPRILQQVSCKKNMALLGTRVDKLLSPKGRNPAASLEHVDISVALVRMKGADPVAHRVLCHII